MTDSTFPPVWRVALASVPSEALAAAAQAGKQPAIPPAPPRQSQPEKEVAAFFSPVSGVDHVRAEFRERCRKATRHGIGRSAATTSHPA